MKKPRRISDRERVNFLQNEMKGRVTIASADSSNVVTFFAFGKDLRAAIDQAIRAGRRSRGSGA